MSLASSINTIETHLSSAKEHAEALLQGRKASASKARASLQSITKEAKQLRKDISEFVKTIPVKSRSKKEEPLKIETPKVEPEQVKVEPELNREYPVSSSTNDLQKPSNLRVKKPRRHKVVPTS